MAVADEAPSYRAPAYKAPAYKAPSYAAPAAYKEEPAKYDFNYAVNDDYAGLNYGHSESRDGCATSGSYSVLLPDGRTQTVTYTVDCYSGYNADVSYSGEAKPYTYNPAPAYKPAPSYKPRPSYNA